ncbi:hypothetical protein ACFSGI_14515 [Paenibacillus nicotianae]|uniref:Uncharacterized protein n=1 Tax=Paenibacillus nicotianae TaxID=1526551 RepID=A0ABW4UXL9_9BACL
MSNFYNNKDLIFLKNKELLNETKKNSSIQESMSVPLIQLQKNLGNRELVSN